MVTSKFLEDNNYVTDADLDKKIQTLDILTKTEASEYIEQAVNSYLDSRLDSAIDQKLDEKIVETADTEIADLFKD